MEDSSASQRLASLLALLILSLTTALNKHVIAINLPFPFHPSSDHRKPFPHNYNNVYMRVTMDDGKFCRCDEGWTCNITPTEASKAGTPFSKCGSSCICITDASTGNPLSDLQKTLESSATGKVFCKCDEGWTCVISKADGPQAGKAFFECGEGCICVIDEANKLQVTCA